MLFIKNLKKFVNREIARCEIFQIKKLNMSKSFKNLV